ncbi:MAG: tetratricopeptide repeat protein [Nitrosomonadales bacterium]|nr:tetratricopeptide repeat protein [Nitrosomonadales bacterium]
MNYFAYIVLLVALISGCANPINERTAYNYYKMALRAEAIRDYASAEQNYDKALFNARIAHSNATISASMYGLGRMKGYLCKYDDAEKLLLSSLTLEEKITGPESSITTMRLFELARLNFDRGQYGAALPYFGRGIPAVKKLGIETSDPISLANEFDEYAIALGKTGHKDMSESAIKEAATLRQNNPGRKVTFTPVRYNQPCTK